VARLRGFLICGFCHFDRREKSWRGVVRKIPFWFSEKPMPYDKQYYLANWNNKVLYIGVTNDLERRVFEHKNKLVKGFTEKYNVKKLVYFEQTSDVNAALAREKEIKKWRREKKNKLIASTNPQWTELKLS
jgi:putative endonuclease